VATNGRFNQTYGRFEVRAKFPNARRAGVHGAFWMYPDKHTYGAWPNSGEIDVAEWWSAAPEYVLPTLHYPGRSFWADSGWGCVIKNASKFHTYAVEWTPTQLRLYVDNVLTRTIDQSLAYPAVFLLGVYENSGWTGEVDPSDPRPKELVIDYFSAYMPDASGGTLSGQNYRLRNVSTGRYLDSDADGAVILEAGSAYDDQQ
jgi:beta-glucanase (GH16 family)